MSSIISDERSGLPRHLNAAVIAGGVVPGLAASMWLPSSVQLWPLVMRTVALFLIVKTGGELTKLIMMRQELLILEDFIRDFSVFIGLSLLSAGCILAAAELIGGWVEPVIPAIGAHIVYTLLPGHRHL